MPNRDWTPVAFAAATQFGSSAKLVSVLTKLDGLAWIMQLGRRYDTQRLNRCSEIIRSLDQPEAASEGCLLPASSVRSADSTKDGVSPQMTGTAGLNDTAIGTRSAAHTSRQ